MERDNTISRENEKTILIKKFICIKEVWSLNMDKLMHEINKGWIKIWEIPFWFIALSGYHRLFWWVLCCWRPFNLLSYCVEVMNFDCKQNFQAASIRLSHYTAWSYEITVAYLQIYIPINNNLHIKWHKKMKIKIEKLIVWMRSGKNY